MGSPLSSFLAEAVMQDLESKAVTNNDDIKTWDRYIDDVFATVKKDKTHDILQTINNTTKNIKLTKEEEHDNELAFLDVLITKTDNDASTAQVYRKKTHRSNFKLQ
jgi:aspartyl/asparaginyl-tRNA synthetase